MEQNHQAGNISDGEIDILELVHRCLKEWKYILKWTLVCGVVGVVLAVSTPKEYSATSILAPEIAKKTSNSISSLANLAGVNINALSNSEAMTPEVYPDVVLSTPFIVDMFSLPVEFSYKGEQVSTDLYTFYKDYRKSSWFKTVLSFPMSALSWFVNVFKQKEESVEGYVAIDKTRLTVEQNSMANAIRSSITVMVEKKTNITTISVVNQNPRIAYLMCARISELLQQYVTDYHTEKARNDADYYQKVFDKAQEEYFAAQKQYARYVDSHHGVVLQSYRTEEERLKNEMELKYKIYNSCAQQLQSAQAKIQLDTPAFAVASPATTPLKPFKPSKLKYMVGLMFLGFVISVFWVLYGRIVWELLKAKLK